MKSPALWMLPMVSLIPDESLQRSRQGFGATSEVKREFEKTANSLDSEKHSLDNATNSLDKDISGQLKKRQSQEETKVVLLDLCKEKWLSRAEIAKLMSRNAEYLRKRFINPLVLEGLLQLRYPDKPNSKEQEYRTVSNDPIEDESE